MECCPNFYHIVFCIQAPNGLGNGISNAMIWGLVLLGLKPFRPAMLIAGLWHGRLRGGKWSGLGRGVVAAVFSRRSQSIIQRKRFMNSPSYRQLPHLKKLPLQGSFIPTKPRIKIFFFSSNYFYLCVAKQAGPLVLFCFANL